MRREGDARRFEILVGAIALAAMGLRAAYVWSLRSTPWFDVLSVDPAYYDRWATEIAAGRWLGDRVFYMDPLYPYVPPIATEQLGRLTTE